MKDERRYSTSVLGIDEIIPYWRNPRRVTDEAVNAVAQSLQEYGYNQPIVVDAEKVIVIGHTRYAALRRLGVEQVPVKIVDLPPARAKELRIIDNRTSELTSWNFEDLTSELEELDSKLLSTLFPEIDISGMDREPTAPSSEEQPPNPWDGVDPRVEFVCSHCFHSFKVQVTREMIMSGLVRVGRDS